MATNEVQQISVNVNNWFIVTRWGRTEQGNCEKKNEIKTTNVGLPSCSLKSEKKTQTNKISPRQYKCGTTKEPSGIANDYLHVCKMYRVPQLTSSHRSSFHVWAKSKCHSKWTKGKREVRPHTSSILSNSLHFDRPAGEKGSQWEAWSAVTGESDSHTKHLRAKEKHKGGGGIKMHSWLLFS